MRKIAAVLLAFVVITLVDVKADAFASTACAPDRTPGVVTQWEFNHAEKGMTRQRVTCLFGVKGYAYLRGNNDDQMVVRYPFAQGGRVGLVFDLDFENSTSSLVLKALVN